MIEPRADGSTVAWFARCGGCGKDIILDREEAELVGRADDIRCAECSPPAPPEADGRTYEARLVLTIDGEEAAGGAASCTAGSFADAAEYLGTELGRRWEGIVKSAALVDGAAPSKEETPT